MKFSANLGFLWRELSLPEAIRASKQAGFHAVECHWPYDVTTAEMKAALAETGLTMLSLNTIRGHRDAGDNGLSALVGRETEARFAIDQAIAYAAAINTPNIHVMAGFASGDMAHQTFIENLQYATAQAAAHGMTILIEPLNHYDAPGYFLQTSGQARAIIEEVGADNLKLMFDCYHLQIMEGNISRRLAELLPIIGHIQIASVPDRAEPDSGELDYGYVFEVLEGLGYEGFIGAEYRPHNSTDNGLGWLRN
ncbi:MAG: hydroxypyruvate isomerase family protein [Leucothrix sp.]